MKHTKLLLSLSFLLMAGISTKAQDTLTNREIYNFEIGDIIHTSYYKLGSPKEFVKRKIESKNYSTNLDTAFYEVTDSVYRYSPPMGYVLNIENHTIFYSDLDSFPKPHVFFYDEDSSMLLEWEDTYIRTKKEGSFKKNEISYFRGYGYGQIDYSISCYESAGLYFKFIGYENSLKEEYSLLYFKRDNNVEIGNPLRDLDKERQLTNREIYDYNVGDIFHFRSAQSPFPVYRITNVIERIEHDSQDRISYRIVDSTYDLVFNPAPYLKLTKVREYTVTYPLNEAPISFGNVIEFHYSYDTFFDVVKNIYYLQREGVSGYVLSLCEGIGSVYSRYNNPISGPGMEELLYYKKGDKERGSRISLNLSVEDINPITIKIYPNPAQSELFVEEIPAGGEYRILNTVGAEVTKGIYEGGSIPVSNFSQGIYLIQISTNEQLFQARFVKE